jgi:hypothetical protein
MNADTPTIRPVNTKANVHWCLIIDVKGIQTNAMGDTRIYRTIIKVFL